MRTAPTSLLQGRRHLAKVHRFHLYLPSQRLGLTSHAGVSVTAAMAAVILIVAVAVEISAGAVVAVTVAETGSLGNGEERGVVATHRSHMTVHRPQLGNLSHIPLRFPRAPIYHHRRTLQLLRFPRQCKLATGQLYPPLTRRRRRRRLLRSHSLDQPPTVRSLLHTKLQLQTSTSTTKLGLKPKLRLKLTTSNISTGRLHPAHRFRHRQRPVTLRRRFRRPGLAWELSLHRQLPTRQLTTTVELSMDNSSSRRGQLLSQCTSRHNSRRLWASTNSTHSNNSSNTTSNLNNTSNTSRSNISSSSIGDSQGPMGRLSKEAMVKASSRVLALTTPQGENDRSHRFQTRPITTISISMSADTSRAAEGVRPMETPSVVLPLGRDMGVWRAVLEGRLDGCNQ